MRFGLFKPNIRQRLWIALAMLAASTLVVGAIAWYALDRANTQLEQVHSQTLAEVAQSLRLSKQSSDLATSAPFLLNLRSTYLIQREGQRLIDALQPSTLKLGSPNYPSRLSVFEGEERIAEAILQMKIAIGDLMESADLANRTKDVTLHSIALLSQVDRQLYLRSISPNINSEERRVWLALQAMTNELVGAATAGNLLGVGENRRKFQVLLEKFDDYSVTAPQAEQFGKLENVSRGEAGLFQLRRRELSQTLSSQNALFRIRYNAGNISSLTALQAQEAEDFLSLKRAETKTLINFAKGGILMAGIGSVIIALVSSVFVSGYVTGNIAAISDAMLRLAQGDRRPQLARQSLADDEIGKLLQSFRVFRANALRLDRSNRQLKQNNALFEKVFANISDGVAIMDGAGQLTAANPNFSEVLRLDANLLDEKPDITQILSETPFAVPAFEAGVNADFRGFVEVQGDDGQVLEVRCSRLPDGGGVWMFSDATERRQLAERLRQIQHIESLGKVTGEVAHDFGNILSTVTSNVHLLETDSRKGERKTLLQRISNAVDIGTSLTQRLLAFARQQALAPEVVELGDLIAGLVDLISIGLKDDVTLKTDLQNTPLYVRVDPGQLESAILNLCLNANQAISETGSIWITVSKTDDTAAVIKVKDDGCGMDAAMAARAPEPFFTARSDGQGTGLGLSMVFGFIKQTGGEMQISSIEGRGTSVSLTLPLAVELPTAAESKGKTVLLVEDDPRALAVTAQQLRDLGYDVQEAATFAAAVAILNSPAGIYAMVTDLNLDQGQSGWDLADIYLSSSPGAKIVVNSGHMPETHAFSGNANPQVICINKPLSAEVLARALDGLAAAST